MTALEAFRAYRWQLLVLIVIIAGVYFRVVPKMVSEWYHDDNYSHGFIVPIIAGYFISQRLEELKITPIKPNNWGILLVFFALVQLTVAWLGTEYFTMRSSLIELLAGIVLFLFGLEVFKVLLLPLCYLIFMVPIPYLIYDTAAFPLKLFVTRVSVGFLNLIGVVVLREGNVIMFPSTTLEVADACSGIRSLMSLLALATAYAFYLETSKIRRFLIIISAVPIAIATNALRVIVTGILAQWWGTAAAEGFFHEFAGLMVFALAMVLLVAEGSLLTRSKQ